MKTYQAFKVSLASRNPNINGFYYDEISFKRAIDEYVSSGNAEVYTGFGNARVVIGKVNSIDVNSNTAVVFIDTSTEVFKNELVKTSHIELYLTFVLDASVSNNIVTVNRVLNSSLAVRDFLSFDELREFKLMRLDDSREWQNIIH